MTRQRLKIYAVLMATLACAAFWGPALVAPLGDTVIAQRSWWQQHLATWTTWQNQSPLLFLLLFMASFTLLSALALPGCAPLALLAGGHFGWVGGTLVVGIASTLGATLSFLAARRWARQALRRRLGESANQRLQALEASMTRHGWLWLFWLRLVPLVPYPVLNALLGLSRLPTARFLWPSLAGLTLGSLPYVWVGVTLQGALDSGRPDWAALVAAPALLLTLVAVGRRWLRLRSSEVPV